MLLCHHNCTSVDHLLQVSQLSPSSIDDGYEYVSSEIEEENKEYLDSEHADGVEELCADFEEIGLKETPSCAADKLKIDPNIDPANAYALYASTASEGSMLGQFYAGLANQLGRGVEVNHSEAARYYRMAALQGNALAQCNLGVLYANGQGVTKSISEALWLLKKAADAGNAKAQYNLGLLYKRGDGVERDLITAFLMFKSAAEQQLPEAQHCVGICFLSGIGTEKAEEHAISWLRRAADQKCSAALCTLAICHYRGVGVEKNLEAAIKILGDVVGSGSPRAQYLLGVFLLQSDAASPYQAEEAIKLISAAAEAGHTRALLIMGWHWERGIVLPRDYSSAAECYRKSADNGCTIAKYHLGKLYEHGLGVSKNLPEALRCYAVAAEDGHARANYALGLCYESGHGGLVKDMTRAVQCYISAADQGVAEAQYRLGLYYAGLDIYKAVYYYQLAADQSFAPAQVQLGICFEHGNGVTRDMKRAFQQYQRASSVGNIEAHNCLGLCYEFAKAVVKDDVRAVEYYTLAALKGLPEAQCRLGYCYEHGIGVERNMDTAVHFYRLSADQRFPQALYNMGMCFEYGYGVAVNMEEATRHYELAAEQGMIEAQSALLLFSGKGEVILCGYLEKQGGSFKSWKKRFFTLSRDGILNYYVDDSLRKLKGTLDCSGSFELRLRPDLGRLHFEIDTSKLGADSIKRTMLLIAPEKDTLDVCVKTFAALKSKLSEGKLLTTERASDKPVMKGFLTKQGGSLTPKWQRRYFVLFRDGMLRYFEDSTMRKVKGSINCVHATVNKNPEDGPFNFTIDGDKIFANSRVLKVFADDMEQLHAWTNSLKIVSDVYDDQEESIINSDSVRDRGRKMSTEVRRNSYVHLVRTMTDTSDISNSSSLG